MAITRFNICLLLICFFCSGCVDNSAAEKYFDLLDLGLNNSLSQLPKITDSAQTSANLLLAGGTIYAADFAADFQLEATIRAGGLMCVKRLAKDNQAQPRQGDIVIAGISRLLTADDCRNIINYKQKGVYVILFGSSTLPGPQQRLPDVFISGGNVAGLRHSDPNERTIYPTDTVLNVVNMWSWMGELASALSRQGRWPIFCKSYGLEGGPEWMKKYNGKVFHSDFAVKPIQEGVLAKKYINFISESLTNFRKTELAKLKKSALLWRNADSKNNTAMITDGHLFPLHFKDNRAAQKINMHHIGDIDLSTAYFQKGSFVYFSGYQYPPKELINNALKDGFTLVYTTVKSADIHVQSENIIYLNPYWPLEDGCVKVADYDIAILPASGVIDAAIYWSMLSEMQEGSQIK